MTAADTVQNPAHLFWRCPACRSEATMWSDGRWTCDACGETGEALVFQPVISRAETPVTAMPDDAVCAYHPKKQATAVCAGTGDYICSLCAVELNGRTYSIHYLNDAGKNLADQQFARHLKRPDRMVVVMGVLSFLFFFVAVVTLPLMIYYFVAMIRQRRADALYAQLVGGASVVAAGLAILVFTGLVALMIFGIALT